MNNGDDTATKFQSISIDDVPISSSSSCDEQQEKEQLENQFDDGRNTDSNSLNPTTTYSAINNNSNIITPPVHNTNNINDDTDSYSSNNSNNTMMIINSTILHEDDNQLLTRNYLIELLSQASIAIKYDLLDNQYSQAKKLYIQVATKLDQLSPFVPQQYSKILIKYSKLYLERANHLSKLNQQEQFNNNNSGIKNVSNANLNTSNVSEGITTEDNFIVVENNATNTNNTTISSNNNTLNVPGTNLGGSTTNISTSTATVVPLPVATLPSASSSSTGNMPSNHSLSNILSNHKKIKKSVKELNAELHDYLYPPEPTNTETIVHPIIFNDKYQFMEEEIPNYSSEFDVPTKYRHRTYWLIKRLSQTMLNGGHLFPNLYISKKVWFQQGAKLFGQSHKITFCQKLSDCISEFKADMLIHSKNGRDIKLIDFGNVIYIQDKLLNNMLTLQKELSKYINLNIQLQQSNQPLSIQDPNMFNLFLDDENEDENVNNSNSNNANTTTGSTSANNSENENYNIDSSISLSSKVFGFGRSMFKTISNTIKGNAKEETSERPYVPWLIQVFNNIHFFDDWITIYEDLLKEFSTTSKIREIEELKLVLERFERISLILHTTLCNFVLQDLQILLERFILKSRDSLSKLFVQKNVPIL